MIPKRILVLRLFNKEEIKNDQFDPRKVPLESNKWIEFKNTHPDKGDLCFIKNGDGTGVSKSFYLCDYDGGPMGCNWYHATENTFIPDSEISAWMPVYNTTEKDK